MQDIYDLAKTISDDDPRKEMILLAKLLREAAQLERQAGAPVDDEPRSSDQLPADMQPTQDPNESTSE